MDFPDGIHITVSNESGQHLFKKYLSDSRLLKIVLVIPVCLIFLGLIIIGLSGFEVKELLEILTAIKGKKY